ncbi:MAG: type VI secretion system tube protein Hcp [Pseudomonadota bacterium]
MYFSGTNSEHIVGESQDHQLSDNNAFELTEFTIKGENSTNVGSSTTGAGGAGKVKFDRLNLKKYTDSASAGFYKALIEGLHIQEGHIRLRRNGMEYMKFDFLMCIVAEIETSQSGEDEAEDSIVCDYGAIKVTYTQQDSASGEEGAEQGHEFSRVTNNAAYEI